MELPKPHYYYSHECDPYEQKLKDISYAETITPQNKNVVYIIPPSPQVPTPGREFLVTGPFEGFTYIASLTKKMGYNTTIFDCRLKEDLETQIIEAVKDADIIGIATYCDSFVFLETIPPIIKARFPEKLIILGGPLVTSIPEIIMETTCADCALVGEAELTLIELFETYFSDKNADLSHIKGLVYRENDNVIANDPRPQIKDLDNLPLLDYTVWPQYDSIVKNGQILISSTRGCPQQCSFCFKTIPALRMKSIERFQYEVEYLKKTTGFTYTWLNDLTFNVVEDRALQISRILKENDIQFHCFARVVNVTDKLCSTLKECNCLGIWFGVESCDQNVLDINRKNIDMNTICQAVATAEKAGLAVRGLFIVGLSGETEGSLKKMLSFIEENSFLPLVKYLVPFPGTSVYEHCVETNIIPDIKEFLRMLSRRKISDFDDEIINVTDIEESVIRHYFHEIWKLTKEREQAKEYQL